MVKQKLLVINPEGLHLRPAGVFAQEMDRFKCDITIRYKGTRVNAKSLLGVLSLGIIGGTQIRIIAGGVDEEAAVEELVKLVSSGFTE